MHNQNHINAAETPTLHTHPSGIQTTKNLLAAGRVPAEVPVSYSWRNPYGNKQAKAYMYCTNPTDGSSSCCRQTIMPLNYELRVNAAEFL